MRDHQKVAIVTGGARGIGRGCALRLAQSGCNIVLIDLLEPEMKSTSDEIRKLGSQCITFSADVADHQVAQMSFVTFIPILGDWTCWSIMLESQCRLA